MQCLAFMRFRVRLQMLEEDEGRRDLRLTWWTSADYRRLVICLVVLPVYICCYQEDDILSAYDAANSRLHAL